MKTFIKNLFLLTALIVSLNLILAGRATAQTFTTLHSFTAISSSSSGYTNSDGATPTGLLLSGNTLYGGANDGGSTGNGILFKVNTNGMGFTNLHSFTFNDGANPNVGLVLSGNFLCGMAAEGGNDDGPSISGLGDGTIFAVNTDGTGFTNLYKFDKGNDGAVPFAGLILSGSTLYGTTDLGGSAGKGTVFKINADGTGFKTLHSFSAGHMNSSNYFTNSDGVNPGSDLILSGNTLYGTAGGGGRMGNGAIFKVNTDGTGFTNLHDFTASDPYSGTNSDGALPRAGLILLSNTLYGTAEYGGNFLYGTVFAVNTDGTGFTNLHSFNGSDGFYPKADLALSGSNLYGTAGDRVFAINTDGTGFTALYVFGGGQH